MENKEDLLKKAESIIGSNPEAFEQLQQAADNGDVESQLLIAECFRNAIGCNKNIDKWVRYIRKAEAADNVYARRELVDYYKYVSQMSDYVDLLKKGSLSGDVRLTVLLADAYANGVKDGDEEVVEVDLEGAHKIVKTLKDAGTTFDNPDERLIIERIETRYSTIMSRNAMRMTFNVFVITTAIALLLIFSGLLGLILCILLVIPSIKYLLPWYKGYVQKVDELWKARIFVIIAGVICIPLFIITVFALTAIVSVFL